MPVIERRPLESILNHFVYCDNSLYDFIYKLYPHMHILSSPSGSNFICFVSSLSPQSAALITARHSNFICLSTTYADVQLTVLDVAGLSLDFASRYRGFRRRKVEVPVGKEFDVISGLLDVPGYLDGVEDVFPTVFSHVGTTNFAQSFLEYANRNDYAIRSVATFMNNVYQTATTGVGSTFYQKTAVRLRSRIVTLPQLLNSQYGDYPDDLMSFIYFHNTLFKL